MELNLFPGGSKSSKDGYAAVALITNRQLGDCSKFQYCCEINHCGLSLCFEYLLSFCTRKKRADLEWFHRLRLSADPTPQQWNIDIRRHQASPRLLLPRFRASEWNRWPYYQVIPKWRRCRSCFQKGEIIHSHRLIINCQKPDLSELCETYSDTNPMPIEDVDPLAPSIIWICWVCFIIFELMPQSGRLNLLILSYWWNIKSQVDF